MLAVISSCTPAGPKGGGGGVHPSVSLRLAQSVNQSVTQSVSSSDSTTLLIVSASLASEDEG